jgi:hypothetical protein
MRREFLPTQRRHPVFVDTLAWLIIALAGIATLSSILQNIMINVLFPISGNELVPHDMLTRNEIPALFLYILSHIVAFAFCILVISAGVLASGIGLLRRKNWARLAVITVMIVLIIASISGVIVQWTLMPALSRHMHSESFAYFSTAFSSVTAVGMVALFVWIIRRLMSPLIKAEFLVKQ